MGRGDEERAQQPLQSQPVQRFHIKDEQMLAMDEFAGLVNTGSPTRKPMHVREMSTQTTNLASTAVQTEEVDSDSGPLSIASPTKANNNAST